MVPELGKLNERIRATKHLRNCVIYWIDAGHPYNFIYTLWNDGVCHLEYRNMLDVDDVYIIYSTIHTHGMPNQKTLKDEFNKFCELKQIEF